MNKHPKRGLGSKKKTNELVAGLSRWAEVDMGLSREVLPSNDEFKALLGGGSGQSMWEYILTHVNKAKTVQVVKKNIQLHSNDVTGRRSRLLTERAELHRELTSLRVAVTQLEGDLSRLKKDIATTTNVMRETEEEIKELSRKSRLVSAHSVKCKDMVTVVNEFSKRIQYRVQALSHGPKEKSYFAKAGGVGEDGLQLESVCKRDLALSCDAVKSLLVQLAWEKDEETDRESTSTKEQIWSRLEMSAPHMTLSLLSDHAPSELMQCLCSLTVEATSHLSAATSDVDLARDAKLLRCGYDPAGAVIKQDGTGTNLLRSVKDHLMTLQLSHIQRSVGCEHYLHSAASAHQKLSLLKAKVDNHFSTFYVTDSEGADLVRSLFHVGLELSGSEGALSALSLICNQLNSVREERREALKTLQHKKQQIDQFTQIAEERQSRIQALVRGNSASWSTLHKQRNELEHYILTKVLHHEAQLLQIAAGLHDSVNFELQRFSRLSLARMLRAPGSTRMPVADLSIHRLCNAHPNGLPHLTDLVETVGVATYVSPECLLSRLCFLVEEVDEVRHLLVNKEGTLEEVRKTSPESLPCTGVLLASKRCDRQQLEVGLPALQQALSVASQGLAACTAVQQTLQEWWEQPAQLCGSWITYEGMSFEKWLEQWRVLSSKIQHLDAPPQQKEKT